jgi:hypothetical protein
MLWWPRLGTNPPLCSMTSAVPVRMAVWGSIPETAVILVRHWDTMRGTIWWARKLWAVGASGIGVDAQPSATVPELSAKMPVSTIGVFYLLQIHWGFHKQFRSVCIACMLGTWAEDHTSSFCFCAISKSLLPSFERLLWTEDMSYVEEPASQWLKNQLFLTIDWHVTALDILYLPWKQETIMRKPMHSQSIPFAILGLTAWTWE